MIVEESTPKFKEVINKHFQENRQWYYDTLAKLSDEFDGKILGGSLLHCPATKANYKGILENLKKIK